MKKNRHIIKKVEADSIAAQMDIEAGDELLAINDQEIEDIFDYRFLIRDEYIEVFIRKTDGEEWLLEIDKDEDEDLGLEFENSMMDEYRSCHNKCIFCFIDQMPKGMRQTLYFKDDDSRLSFLQGNYVTLTNMSDSDIDRICRYRLEPINISFQTTNPELRCKMLGNRFAGEALKKVDKLYEAGIEMNGQIVLCKGINDGDELRRSIRDMWLYFPYLRSVSVVPVGLTRFREGLYPLEPFEKEDAEEVIDIIEGFQKEFYSRRGAHFVHASDEWYLVAGRELPEAERYDGYLQYENGVGMLRLLRDEFDIALNAAKADGKVDKNKKRSVSVATGKLAYATIVSMAERLMEVFPFVLVHVYCIENKFFGQRITVSGLLTGGDIIDALKDKDLGEVLFLPENVLRSGEEVFLDDVTVTFMRETLQVETDIVKSNGLCFLEQLCDVRIDPEIYGDAFGVQRELNKYE